MYKGIKENLDSVDSIQITQKQIVNLNENLGVHEKLPGFITSKKSFYIYSPCWHLSFCLLSNRVSQQKRYYLFHLASRVGK